MSNAQNVLITGSSSGFGLLTTRTLLEEGYTVLATMRDRINTQSIAIRNLTNANNIADENRLNASPQGEAHTEDNETKEKIPANQLKKDADHRDHIR